MIEIEFDEAQVERWAATANGQLLEFAVEFLQDLCDRVVENTPVITGHLRRSWYGSIGESADGEPGANGDPVGSVGSILADLQIGDVFTFENGAEYAPYVEDGTRHMAPRAMVARALDQVQEIGDAAAARVGSTSE